MTGFVYRRPLAYVRVLSSNVRYVRLVKQNEITAKPKKMRPTRVGRTVKGMQVGNR